MKNIQLLLLLILISNTLLAQDKFAYISMVDTNGIRQEGIVLDNGQEIIPPLYEKVVRVESYFFCKNENGYGIYSKNGKLILNHQYEDFGWGISEGLFRLKKDAFWGFLDFEGNVVIPFEYENACNFRNGKAYVFKSGQALMINLKNDVVEVLNEAVEWCEEDVDSVVEWNSQFEMDATLKVKEIKSKFGVINLKGKVIIPIIYDEIGDYDNDVIFVRKGKLWGAYSNKGQLLIEPKYHSLGWFLDW